MGESVMFDPAKKAFFGQAAKRIGKRFHLVRGQDQFRWLRPSNDDSFICEEFRLIEIRKWFGQSPQLWRRV
jgi:hypothetical protein